MKKKGFATSAILYTLLLLFLVLMVGILNNLQNKKTILDALKKDTIQALEHGTVTDAILDQIAIINSKIVELEEKIPMLQESIEHKIEGMFYPINEHISFTSSTSQSYTGVSKTIPANSYFCLSVNANWNEAIPQLVEIVDNSKLNNSAYRVLSSGAYENMNANTTYCAYTSADTTYYIWAKYSAVNTNTIHLRGFYITP